MRPLARTKTTIRSAYAIAVATLLLSASVPANAGDPYSAYYHWSGNRLFWFMVISDSHIGAPDSQDTAYLNWAVTEARSAIDPLFIVNCGDLTDSTNGGTIPNGPYTAEWQAYRDLLAAAGIDASGYYDVPGNHDHYNDPSFAYYRAYSIQGPATGATQHSWTRTFPFGAYHFIAVSTPGNDGAPFSIWPWDDYGDHAGIDTSELAFIGQQLTSNPTAQLTLIFGHHPFEEGYSSWSDTGLGYGRDALLNLIDTYGVSAYSFGHTHDYRENIYYDNLTDGVFYLNVASLGKSNSDHIAVIAVDGNGISVKPASKGQWPIVMITAPVDQNLGASPQPFAYDSPKTQANPIRALVFDPNPILMVEFRIDEADWQPMLRADGNLLWQGFWNAAVATEGPHTVEVRATGSATVTDKISTRLNQSLCFGDTDQDGDVDGSDLAAFSKDYVPEVVFGIAAHFGKPDCGNH